MIANIFMKLIDIKKHTYQKFYLAARFEVAGSRNGRPSLTRQRELRLHYWCREIGVPWHRCGVVIDRLVGEISANKSRYEDWWQCWAKDDANWIIKRLFTKFLTIKNATNLKEQQAAKTKWLENYNRPNFTRGFNSVVVVRVDTHFVTLQAEREFAVLCRLQLVVVVQVRPSPDAAVDHMRQTLFLWHLQAAVKGPKQFDKPKCHAELPKVILAALCMFTIYLERQNIIT